jgi:hypothetical protein
MPQYLILHRTIPREKKQASQHTTEHAASQIGKELPLHSKRFRWATAVDLKLLKLPSHQVGMQLVNMNTCRFPSWTVASGSQVVNLLTQISQLVCRETVIVCLNPLPKTTNLPSCNFRKEETEWSPQRLSPQWRS